MIGSDLSRRLKRLCRQYAAQVPTALTRLELPSPRELSDELVQQWLVDHLINSPTPRSHAEHTETSSWSRAFWKRIVADIELGLSLAGPDQQPECEIHEEILFILVRHLQTQLASTCLRRYYYGSLDPDPACWPSVTLLEDSRIISQGTTGLRSWQASIRLANHLLAMPYLLGRATVIELGSGTGLLACLCAQLKNQDPSLGESPLIVTDLDEQVLLRLQANVDLNDVASNVCIQKLDWCQPELPRILPNAPKRLLILGADIVYDPALCRPLAKCIHQLLSLSSVESGQALIASTVRNPQTLQTFRDALSACRLEVHERTYHQPGSDAEIVGACDEEQIGGAKSIMLEIVARQQHYAVQST
ncbi:uncharacterized protein L969DRAFT_91295 [Mixia osmundae IAM 14324]|uniref:FAM86 N-terminal domain-containing protein n=1 Tax=Mixia osmundae (strain CBS 9802 / IAM 14324 / JCM 22182 / KY 12970) TaxID=764103 RepID=G7DSS2_MIXOS|nr:uncharacterized protein L969DRAFT_91295 [Mixia osmundae IAM 14324]KEI41814.1 hypothetical protein L969DRAFT_91295 [Mixia osmundae IAM 14324]GAA93630.1 hypothetical protein E5Q_00274 [Mixia osmundae IAM 14324]